MQPEQPYKTVNVNLYDFLDLFHGKVSIPAQGEASRDFYLPSSILEGEPWLYGCAVYLVNMDMGAVGVVEGVVNDKIIGGQTVDRGPIHFIYYDLPTPPLRRGNNTLTIRNKTWAEMSIDRVDVWVAVNRRLFMQPPREWRLSLQAPRRGRS